MQQTIGKDNQSETNNLKNLNNLFVTFFEANFIG